MRHKIFVCSVLGTALALGLGWRFLLARPYTTVTFSDGSVVLVEIVDTPKARMAGLGGRSQLARASGMLFVFQGNPAPYAFWAKDMRFLIDIIWLNGDEIVDIASNVTPPQKGETPPLYTPRAAADRAIEVVGGFTQEKRILIGSKVGIDKKVTFR